jgi:hypothetical protein
MSNDPFASPGQLSEDLGLFEAAAHSRPMELAVVGLQTIALALDGSNQDPTATRVGELLGQARGARVVQMTGGRRAADILTECQKIQADLLIVPVPYGHDIGELKDESLGSIVDMLLIESKCPILCIRHLLDDSAIAAAMADVVVPVACSGLDDASRAASWGLHIVAAGGHCELLAVADQDAVAELRELLTPDAQTACDAETLSRAVTDEISSLAAVVQKRAAETGLAATVVVRTGRFVPTVLADANSRPRMIIVGTPRDHTAPAFHRAADLILGARGPVLIV